MFESFGHLMSERPLRKQMYFGVGNVVVLPDTNIIRRFGFSFFESISNYYSLCLTSGVSEEVLNYMCRDSAEAKEFSDLSNFMQRVPILDFGLKYLKEISSATKEGYSRLLSRNKRCGSKRDMRKGDLGFADNQQISFALSRARNNRATVLITNDIGILKTCDVLSDRGEFNGFAETRYLDERLDGNLSVAWKYLPDVTAFLAL